MRHTVVVGHHRRWQFPYYEPIDESDPPELLPSSLEKIWLAADCAVLQLFHAVVLAGAIVLVLVLLAVGLSYL